MKKLLLIAGAVCALAFFTASADAGHGCRSGFGGGFGGYRGHDHGRVYDYGYRGRGFRGHDHFFAPRRGHVHRGHGRRHNHYGPGLHLGGRGFRLGIHF